ncbi:rubisco large subunit N-methyltransferase [Chloropicon primus]|nr:rubisco large subunit N-methyltransferase [Chloropicon primus]
MALASRCCRSAGGAASCSGRRRTSPGRAKGHGGPCWARRGRAEAKGWGHAVRTHVGAEGVLETSWLESFNVQEFRGCSLEVVAGRLCLVASRAADAGDVLLRVPIDETLSESVFDEVFPGAGGDGSLAGLEPWMKLVLVLLRFRAGDEEGKWMPLLRALDDSRTFRRHPLLWDEADLLELQCTQTFEKLKAYNEYLETTSLQMEEFVYPVLGLAGRVSREDFFWAFGALKTNALRPFSQPQALRLVPVLNILSHGRRTNCNSKFASSGIFKKDETLDLLATRSLQEGDVLAYDFDPAKAEIDILVDYGVFDVEAPSGGMELTLELDENDPNYLDKCDVVEEAAGLQVRESFAVSEGSVPGDVLAFLRLVKLEGFDAFLLEPVFRSEIWGFMKDPVSRENETNVCVSMIQSCEEALAEFPTSIEEDEEILARLAADGGSKHSNARIAVEARLVEKRTLRSLVKFFRAEKAQIPFKEYYQERRLKSLNLLDMDGNSTY